MNQLPITLGFFTCSRGHFGRFTDYRLTLDHWDKQIPLKTFNLVAHVKIDPTQTERGEQMATELRDRGFHVLTTTGTWARGLSMGSSYLGDMIKMSKEPKVYAQPYFILVEDDNPVVSLGSSLEDLLLRSCHLLATNHELTTVRTIRKGDYDGGVPTLGEAEEGRAFYSPHTDYQTILLRSLDFSRLGMILEANPEACANVQCEQLWALALRQFSRSPLCNLVWKPSWAYAVHLGVPQADHEQIVRQLNLS